MPRILLALLIIVAASGCVVHKSEVVPPPGDPDCWVQIYDTDNFNSGSSSATIRGPIDLATLDNLEGKDWEDEIESLIVGPDAELHVWKSMNYAGTELTFQPGQKVAELGDLDYANEIGSMKVVCK
jgi:hypothetical protein